MRSAQRVLVCRRPPVWLAGLAIVVAALFGYIGAHQVQGSVQGDLTERTNQNLVRNGVNNVGVSVDGRNVQLNIPAGVDPALAEHLTEQVTGVGAVSVTGPGAPR